MTVYLNIYLNNIWCVWACRYVYTCLVDGKLFQAVNGICLVQKLKSWRSWLDGPFNLRLLADDILFNDCSNAFAPWDAWYPRESWALIAIRRSWFSLRCPSSSKNVYDLGLSLVNMISPIEKPNTTKREKNILKSNIMISRFQIVTW